MRKPRLLAGRAAPRLVRLSALAVTLAGALVLGAGAATRAEATLSTGLLGGEPLCESHHSLCRDAFKTPGDEYVGHDEPSVAFRSSEPGSANDMTYTLRLPDDPSTKPQQDGSGGTWNFQLRPTFWFGLTMCDSESAPEFTKTCTPDSDANALEGSNPNAADYIGKHPGNAFLELQFYGPGYVPQFEGFGCAATRYCAAMTIDSFNRDQNTHTDNTKACDNYILGGVEPINWAYITKSGVSQAPADPLFTGTFDNPNFAAVNPDFNRDLMMKPGDVIRIHMHDTPAGYRADLTDLTTNQSGSMTASIANGFAHVLYTPTANTCTSAPYAFHAEYSTANARGNTWSAHLTNVSFSDEIGHFENCPQLDADFNCAVAGADDPGGLDVDDGQNFCVPGKDAWVVHINGCFFNDVDFDGPSYQNDWPGTNPDPKVDQKLHPEPVVFTSPTTNGHQYPTIQFEADLGAIESTCNTVTGAGCTNPPPGAAFYPFFSTRSDGGACAWQEGGNFIPGTVNNFGGSSATEFTHLISQIFPGAGF
ncbi:MAG TPA: hypothetical protein VE757_02875, partial [Gaiellaceae bacterium]|nr:hypothetical protein [Gaiellaceae bacterium]